MNSREKTMQESYDEALAKTMQAMRPPEPQLIIIGNGPYTSDGKNTICYLVGICLGHLARKLKRLASL